MSRVVCAWCGDPTGAMIDDGETGDSHGQCDTCYENWIAEVERMPPVQAQERTSTCSVLRSKKG